MENRKKVFVAFLTLASIVAFSSASAQTTSEPTSSIKVTADLVSHYVWRGSMATGSPTPNFQPTLAYTKGNFEIGVWGSTDFVGSYKEVDPYVSLTVGKLKFTLTDYDWNFGDTISYFNYKDKETRHRFEASIGYTGPESMPIYISLSTMFYGLDKKVDDNGELKQAYSTYVELGYVKGPATFFFGFTPMESYYNNYGYSAFDPSASKKTFSIVNIGTTVTKSVKITDSYSLPLKATLVINPSATYSRADYIHLVFGITF